MIEDVEHVRAKSQAAGFAEPDWSEEATQREVNVIKPWATKSIPPGIAQNACARLSESLAHNRIQQTHAPGNCRALAGFRSARIGDIGTLIDDLPASSESPRCGKRRVGKTRPKRRDLSKSPVAEQRSRFGETSETGQVPDRVKTRL